VSRFCFDCPQRRTRALCAAQRMQSKPECCILPRKREYGMEEWNGALADAPFFGAAWLEIANQCCENRIPYAVSLVNPQFAIFPEKGVHRRGFSVFSTFCPKNPPCFGRKPTCFLLLFKVVLVIIVTQDFVGRFSFLSTPCSQSCRRRQFRTVSPPENRLCSAVFQRLSS
jgi:hypothetical protein